MLKVPHFVHYRALKEGFPAPHGGVTIYLEPRSEVPPDDGEHFSIAITFAVCSPKDQFNRRIGRLASKGRMRTAHRRPIQFVRNGDDGERLWREIDQIVSSAWARACAANGISNLHTPVLQRGGLSRIVPPSHAGWPWVDTSAA